MVYRNEQRGGNLGPELRGVDTRPPPPPPLPPFHQGQPNFQQNQSEFRHNKQIDFRSNQPPFHPNQPDFRPNQNYPPSQPMQDFHHQSSQDFDFYEGQQGGYG